MRKTLTAILCGCSLCGAPAFAVDMAVLAQFYGNGVHRFYAGDYQTAFADLTSAIDGGTEDPRAFYFRGLTMLSLGREPEANADFKKGAELEALDSTGFYQVGRSLERVQGGKRALLEKHRAAARVALYQKASETRKVRYEVAVRNEAEVISKIPPRKESPAAIIPAPIAAKAAGNTAANPEDPFSAPAAPAVVVPGTAAPAAADPFGPGDVVVTPKVPAAPTPVAPPAAEVDPFSTPPSPPPKQADPKSPPPTAPEQSDPFGTAPPPRSPKAPADGIPPPGIPADTTPIETAPAVPAPKVPATPPAVEAADPFGTAPAPTTPAPAVPPAVEAADPFGASPATPSAPKAPAPPAATEADPFGAAPAPATPAPVTPPAATPAPATPPSAAADPFGAAPPPATGNAALAEDPAPPNRLASLGRAFTGALGNSLRSAGDALPNLPSIPPLATGPGPRPVPPDSPPVDLVKPPVDLGRPRSLPPTADNPFDAAGTEPELKKEATTPDPNNPFDEPAPAAKAPAVPAPAVPTPAVPEPNPFDEAAPAKEAPKPVPSDDNPFDK